MSRGEGGGGQREEREEGIEKVEVRCACTNT